MPKIYIRSLKKSPKIRGKKFEKLALKLLDSENPNLRAEIGITFVSNSYIQDLNQKYRKVNSSTDVIAFRVEVPGNKFLGDVYISLEQVIKQVPENEPLEFEISRLIIHGILHLLGYKHGEKMRAREKHYFSKYVKNQSLKGK
ncbi:rRNA maturation RNase YbeY [candidate division WOR-3 bacterium]|nr:rRNA maturation RNase YbeY [candidate division WOR-3 bacterium]